MKFNSKLKLLFLLVAFTQVGCNSYVNVEEQQCTVKDKEVRLSRFIEYKEDQYQYQYRVYTTCGVYVIEDQPLRLNFRSADLYNNIDVGKTYKITTSNFRISILSKFKEINKIENVEH